MERCSGEWNASMLLNKTGRILDRHSEKMMMKTNCNLFSIPTALALTLASGAAMANAGSLPAFPGVPASPAEAGCWTNSAGELTNICGGSKRTCMPLPVTGSGGWATVNIFVNSPSPSNLVSCFAQSIAPDRPIGYWSGQQNVPSFGSPQMIGLSTYQAPGYNLYACCDVNQGGTVSSVWWGTP